MPESSHKKALKPGPGGPTTSWVRTGVAALLAVGGLAWVLVYVFAAFEGKKLTWMFELGDWNFLIGFGLFFLGLIVASDKSTPLGRGRGIVVGMLGCFLIGLIWIVVYYIVSNNDSVRVIRELGNYNLLVGISFMAVGFVYATKWE